MSNSGSNYNRRGSDNKRQCHESGSTASSNEEEESFGPPQEINIADRSSSSMVSFIVHTHHDINFY